MFTINYYPVFNPEQAIKAPLSAIELVLVTGSAGLFLSKAISYNSATDKFLKIFQLVIPILSNQYYGIFKLVENLNLAILFNI